MGRIRRNADRDRLHDLRLNGRARRDMAGAATVAAWTSTSSSSAPGAPCRPRGARPRAAHPRRRGAAARGLRRGLAAADAAFHRAGPGRRHLPDPLHADHYLGIPGLLKTYQLNARERPLRVIGPPGGDRPVRAPCAGSSASSPTRSSWSSSSRGRGDVTTARDAPFPVEHRMRAYGYALVEDERPGHLDPEAAARLGSRPGPTSAASSAARRSRARTAPFAPRT